MIGFLIHDARLLSTAAALSACRALRSYRYYNTEELGSLRIHYLRNASPNNYVTTDDRSTTCVAGTLLFNNVHGSKALSNLRAALRGGKPLAELFESLRGPYTLLHVDKVAGEASIVSSREGLHNCFLASDGHGRIYSTHLLLLAALSSAAPCAESIRQFIHIGAVLEDKTIFEGVNRLGAATFHTFRNETWTTTRLWRLEPQSPDRKVTRQLATRTVIDSFVGNFEFTANIEPGRVVSDLTAGTDSRTVLCCLLEKHKKPVVSTAGRADHPDVRVARRIAERLGIEHYWYAAAAGQLSDERIARAVELADGTRDVIGLAKALPYYDEKARRFDFITGGDGGPLFKDHYWLFEFNRVGLRREPHWNRLANLSLVAHAVQDDFFRGFSDRVLDNVADLFRRRSAEVCGTNNQKLDFVYFDLKIPAFSSPGFSLTTQFMDVFHPMLDGSTVQYSVNLPPETRIRNNLQFSVIQALRPELRWIRTDTGLPTIPAVGVNSWLRVLRGRRYIATGVRKIRLALLGASGQRVDDTSDIDELRRLGYFDLLNHSSLAASSFISVPKLAEFKASPEKRPNQHYLIGTLSVQLFFERVKELRREAERMT